MDSNKRPESMARITTAELANAFIDEQVALVREQVGDKKVLLALCVLGIDPEEDIRFRKGVETVLTGMDRFRCGDGTYSHLRGEEKGDYLASAQMLLAITALNRLRSGNSWIFDYTGYTGPAQAGPGLLLPLSASAAIVLTAIILIVRKRRNHGKKNG